MGLLPGGITIENGNYDSSRRSAIETLFHSKTLEPCLL